MIRSLTTWFLLRVGAGVLVVRLAINRVRFVMCLAKIAVLKGLIRILEK